MEGDERALFDIGSFLNQFQDRRDEALEELLSHNSIDGEITDSNLQYLDLANSGLQRTATRIGCGAKAGPPGRKPFP